MTLLFGAALLATSGSLRFAQVLGAGAGALCGMAAAAWLGARARPLALAGISLSFTVLLAGMMLVGRVNSFSSVPLASYVLIPVAPLFLWISFAGPLSHLQGMKRATVQFALALTPCAAALVLAALAEQM